ncbi:MAG: hypothetical protein HY854_20555 [Burkholderiales bacterium]|nr:hypothetical protein [Burkholderiales bacterium]
MTEHIAITAPEIVGSVVSDDGLNMLLKVAQVSGQELVIAFPHESLPGLVASAAHAFTAGQHLQGLPSSQVRLTNFEQWDLSPAGDNSVLTITLDGGGRLSFLLQPEVRLALQQALASAGAATP